MPLPTPHYYLVKHPPGFVLSISVNDIPFYRRVSMFHQAPNGPFNHLMLEGENRVTMLLAELTPEPFRTHTCSMSILRQSDDAPLFHAEYPALLEQYPPEERTLPITHKAMFRFDEPSPRPLWLDSPVTDFPIEGTPSQRAAVAELHDAYRRQDIEDFLRAVSTKTDELQRFYGPMPEFQPANARANYGALLSEPWDLDPLDWNDMIFERRGGGRTAYVTRKDGRPALFAKHKTDPQKAWAANLHLCMVGDRWRIFG